MGSTEAHGVEVTAVLEALRNISAAVLKAVEAGALENVLRQIAIAAQELVESRYAAIGVPDSHGAMQYFEVAGMNDEEIHRIDHPPVGHGLLGVIMRDRETLRLEHMHQDPRSIGFPAHHPYMDRLLGVPVMSGGELHGMLYLTDRMDGKPFTASDQLLVELLAGHAALAIAGARLRDQHSRLALLEERERVGMELHDGTIQSLYAIGMELQLLRMQQPAVGDELGRAVNGLDEVIEDIRRYILNLKVSAYEQLTVHESLDDVLARLHIPETLSVKLTAPNRPPPFAPPVTEAVCQIAFEAISNIVRHADATHATVDVTDQRPVFIMTIQDNGRGIDTDTWLERSGLGLHNMAQRARIFGGDLSIETPAEGGTRLTLQLPI